STLISVISAAKPKIANYPFTTLEPNLGVVALDDDTNFVVADIPGLIEGASEGRGLGHRFLRHVERARVLCLLIDLAPLDEMSAQQQEETLLNELGQYRPDLLERPRIVVGTKADMASTENVENFGDRLVISSITQSGVRELVGQMASVVYESRSVEPHQEGVVVMRPEVTGAVVERLDDNEFRLVGREVERVVALNDVTTPEALDWIDSRLERLGISKMLARAGVADGDIVWIGEFSFEYQADV
ncbi:MAG: Obg family GTPase CgtA, partial [Actinomycetota bacterium]|nr:Obg family GTPase CgtA [Actinomycetota bacterium]